MKYAHNAIKLSSGLLAIAKDTINVGVVEVVVADDLVVSWLGRLAVARVDREIRAASAVTLQLLSAY